MASTSSPTEWTVAGVLGEIDELHNTMEDRAIAFVLGSGASFTSGIPTGKEMAEMWLEGLGMWKSLNPLHLLVFLPGTPRGRFVA